MRIGIVCPYNIFRGGGVQECVLALQAELAKRGHHARILTPLSKEARQRTIENVIFLGGGTEVKSPFHTTAQLSASANPEALQKILAEEEYDILHFHEPWVPILSRQLLVKSKAVNIATFHARLPDSVMTRTIERVITPYTKSIVKYLDRLTAVSPAAAQYIESLTSKPITIIPNGIDLKKYKTQSKPTPTKNILYIGRLERRKGLKYLLLAFKLLLENYPDVHLIIAGDGSDRLKLEAFTKDNKINNVSFMGYVDEDEKLRLLAQSTLFCSAALYGESFGIVLLEAMASNVVTVAGNNPGYSTVLSGRGAISLVNPKDTVEFARRLDLMLNDGDLRKLWQSWAAKHVREFDYAKVVGQYEHLYKQAAKDK